MPSLCVHALHLSLLTVPPFLLNLHVSVSIHQLLCVPCPPSSLPLLLFAVVLAPSVTFLSLSDSTLLASGPTDSLVHLNVLHATMTFHICSMSLTIPAFSTLPSLDSGCSSSSIDTSSIISYDQSLRKKSSHYCTNFGKLVSVLFFFSSLRLAAHIVLILALCLHEYTECSPDLKWGSSLGLWYQWMQLASLHLNTGLINLAHYICKLPPTK